MTSSELPATKSAQPIVAAVDLGSNSFHMIVARLENGEVRVVDRMREMVRLGGGFDKRRRITSQARERALACLTRFGQRLSGLPGGCVRAVGTNTLRSAHDAEPLITEMEQALGHPISIISGVEEARLIYLGVAHSLASDGRRRLVMDIGGGSTELIVGRGFEPRYMESLYMGCVSVTQTRFGEGKISRKAIKRALLDVQMELEPVVSRFRKVGWDRPIGASGTIRAVARVIRMLGWEQDGITLRSLHRLKDRLVSIGRVEYLEQLPGLSPERAPVFVGGVMVLLGTCEALGIEQLEVSDGALREGLLYELVGRIRDEDVRSRSIEELARRYGVDGEQANRVKRAALRLFSRLEDAWELEGEPWKRVLGWAAQIHELGLSIAHSQYHKHGAYIAEYSDLAGFSRQEQRILAILVRAHRRKFPMAEFQTLPKSQQCLVRRLAVLLRLAVLFHRSRNNDALPKIKVKARKEQLLLRFPEGWLAQHPLTVSDLEQEAAYLEAAGIQLLFQ